MIIVIDTKQDRVWQGTPGHTRSLLIFLWVMDNRFYLREDIGGYSAATKVYFLGFLIAAWAAARRAMGTRNGLQET